MPEIRRFFGIVIRIYYDDHGPPHFHARYGRQEAKFAIRSGQRLAGHLDRRESLLIETWRQTHETELLACWERAQVGIAGQGPASGVTVMIPRVLEARHTQSYRIWLRFADGLAGEIDLSSALKGPALEPLNDVREFAKVQVDPEWETLTWPSHDVDLAPESQYARLTAAVAGNDAAE